MPTKQMFTGVLAAYCEQNRHEPPEPEFVFHPERKWAFDFAFPAARIAVEIEGGTTVKGGGRHNRPKGYSDDCEKYTEAAILGWCVIRVTWQEVNNGRVYDYIDRAFRARSHDAKQPSHS